MKSLMLRFSIIAVLVFGLLPVVSAQNCVQTINPTTNTPFNHTIINLPCGQTCTDINLKTPHVKKTSTYVVNTIPYTPYPYTSTTGSEDPVLYADDQYSNAVALPFTFPFYDSLFNNTVVGSNGLITFDIANASCGNAWMINPPLPYAGGTICNSGSTYYPKASIMGAYSDLDPRSVASGPNRIIQWHTEGISPCRKFVVSYVDIGVYGNNNCTPKTTFQIVIYEHSGIIEVYFQNKSCASSTNAGRGILGVQNWNRDQAVWETSPNTNAQAGWTFNNEARRFTPAGGTTNFVSSELTTLTGTHIKWADTATTTIGILDLKFPNVCVSAASTQFLIKTIFVSNVNPMEQLISIDTVTINQTSELYATATATATTCGPPNGTITVTVPAAAGTAPFTYTLDNPPGKNSTSHTYTFNNVAAGSHTVYVSDANGCGSTIPITVSSTGTLNVTASATPTSCSSVNNGSITVTPPTGTPPYLYSLNGGTPQSSNVFTNLAPGNYTVTVTDNGGCSGTTTVTVGAGAPITGNATTTASTCPTSADGTITVTPTSGTAPYTYSMDGQPYQSSNIFTGVLAGTHYIVIKDAIGCTSNTIPVTVNSGPPLSGTASSTPTSCPGVNNGTITVTPTSGTPPYQYTLDGGSLQSSNVFTNVSAGPHTVQFKDAAACSSVIINVTVAQGTGVTANATSTATSCSGVNNGTITVTPTTGTAPYQYSLDGAASQSSNVFTNVSAGTHNIIVTDATGCSSSPINVTVAAGSAPTGTATSTPASCNGVNNGTITVTPTTGTAPYQYSLDGLTNQTSNVFTNVAAGNHVVVFTDANGCVSSNINVTVAAVANVTASATSTPTSCPGVNNGTITVTASNGTAPYQYSLNGGAYQSSNTFVNLAPGTYTVVVRDINTCTSNTVSVTVAAGAGVTGTATSTATSCNGASNGTVTVTPNNGASPYQYSLDGGAFQASNVFINVAAGPHTIVFTDAAGCSSSTINVTVAAGAPLTAGINQTNVTCNGLSNGSITVNVNAPGTAPFQYSLDNVTFQASNTFTGLAAGTYTVYFRDGQNCTGTQTVTITQPAALALSVGTQNVLCNGQSNGVITVTGSGGTSPYQYSLNGTTYKSSNTFNVAAGTYTVYIRDNNGCVQTQSNVVITEPAALTASATTQNATCNGGNDGVITVNAGGGTVSYQYSIDGINFQLSNTFTVAPGSYTVTVKDANNCTFTTNATVGLNNTLTFSTGGNPTICEGTSTTLTVNSNATQYNWTPTTGLNDPTIQNPTASPTTTTTYTVTATLGGCSTSGSITVNVNPAPVADAGADADICYGQDAQLSGSGGVNYIWTPATGLNDPTIPNPTVIRPASSTQYSLKVIDANGCTSLNTDVVKVNVTPPIKVTVSPKDSIVAEGDQIQLLATSIATNYSWSNGVTLSDPNIPNPIASMPANSYGNVYSYTVTAYTAAGCQGSATVILKVYKGPDIYVPTAFTPNGDGKNDLLIPLPVGIAEIKYFRVYNRWGQLMYSTTKTNDGWDGKHAGIDQPPAVYVWVVEGVTKVGRKIFRKGTVTLIR